jgi:hypothetical protein
MISKSKIYKNGINLNGSEVAPKYGAWGESMMLSLQRDVEEGTRTQQDADKNAEKLVLDYLPTE